MNKENVNPCSTPILQKVEIEYYQPKKLMKRETEEARRVPFENITGSFIKTEALIEPSEIVSRSPSPIPYESSELSYSSDEIEAAKSLLTIANQTIEWSDERLVIDSVSETPINQK